MNKRWCEGLDWVRVDELLEVAPDVYTELLRNQLEWIVDVHGEEAGREFGKEIRRRMEICYSQPEGQRILSEAQIHCILEALRLNEQDIRQQCDAVRKIVRRGSLRVVSNTPSQE